MLWKWEQLVSHYYEIKNNSPGPFVVDDGYWGERTTTELNSGTRNLTKIYDSRDSASVGAVVIHTWRNNSVTGPVIGNVSPDSGATGSEVSIVGRRFGTEPTAVTVTFKGVSAQVQSVTDTEIQAIVPPVATTGPVWERFSTAMPYRACNAIPQSTFADVYHFRGGKEVIASSEGGNPKQREISFTCAEEAQDRSCPSSAPICS